MENNYNVTNLNKRVLIIERYFSNEGKYYTEVLAYDKKNNMVEYIGTSYDGMEYYFNNSFVVFIKGNEVEFAFDFKKFNFITDETKKMIAFNKILKDSQSEYTKLEKDIITESEEKELVKALTKRLK